MVLDALASYVGDLLKQVVEEELGMLLGISGEIGKMDDKLRDLNNFLVDADRRNITDEAVREWVGQLKRAMYEATDILDLCQLKAMERGPDPIDAGCFNPLLFCMRNPAHAHDIGTRIKALNQRLDAIKERSVALNFINLGSYEDRHSSNVHTSHHGNSSRETSADFDRLGVVGEKIEEDTRALVAQILQTGNEVSDNIMVVAIVGVGGIGKTTLAQKIFNDKAIQDEFSKKIWLSVNQNFNEVELLRKTITEAGGDHRPDGDAKVALHRILKASLIGHKTLLVMDDVWDQRAWEGVLKIPLVNVIAPGSRVLITTRDDVVARGVAATSPYYYHHIDTLGPEDAWSLLKKQVLRSEKDEDHINKLKDIGLKIIKKCGGLPLAIKVMGGLLRKRGEIRGDWEKVLNDAKWSTTGMPQELNSAVYLSYEDMPPYLKQCFLYYSLLPNDKEFRLHEVVSMWISEGFIPGNSNDLEDLGRDYYMELIYRNLIEPNKRYIKKTYCSMHDVVRSFAHYMTKDEALVSQAEDMDILTKLHTQKFLRLSIGNTSELDWKSLQDQQSVRTLITTIQIKMKPSEFAAFSSLRTLHIECVDMAALIELLHELKHLRYLALVNTDISALPLNIGKMKLLQFLDLHGCTELVNLPNSIVNLGQLRSLCLANLSMIPKGFCSFTNMRRLFGFRAHMDDRWCSLHELGPLSQLKLLELNQLENVSAASYAANARLGEKIHLIDLYLCCTNRLGPDGLVKEKEEVSKEEQQRVEKVFNELCPPPSVENIGIRGYFGQQLPGWMMSTSTVQLNNLKILFFSDLACCTQLPNGLCRLPCLQALQVDRAPCIKRVGTTFLQAAAVPFPRLNKMTLIGLVEWEEWEWDQQVQAMVRLERLLLKNCKLWCFPPGLASNARSLKVLILIGVKHIKYLENFPFVVELEVTGSPNLEKITNLRNLRSLTITKCPKLMVLESIPALDKLVLEDYAMEKLPEYMPGIAPRHLQLNCSLLLLSSLAAGQSGSEWEKFSHVENVKAYARDGNNPSRWYVLYTRDNCKFDSNIRHSTAFQETLSSSMVVAQGFESMYKMKQSTFSYVCSLVKIPFLEDMMERDHTFVDGRQMSLQDRVAVALRMLSSGEPWETVGSSIGVNEATASLVTQVLVQALRELAVWQHARWPYSSSETEKVKSKFEKIHGLPNCCGIIHTTDIKFGSQNHDHEKYVYVPFQSLVDADMRFADITTLRPSGSMGQCSIMQNSVLFKDCEKGVRLNGGKLKVSSGGGSEVGEYIIGDAGCPLRPWLLTPYQLDNDPSDSKVEFNRRHSEATAVFMMKVLARLKDTWKCLQGGWHSNGELNLQHVIAACCLLHNIVIDMEEEEEEEEEGPCMHGDYNNQVRQLADEDAGKVRDALSQHLMECGVDTKVAEEEQEVVPVAPSPGDETKEQEACRPQTSDRGKQKVHDI